ncbi:MAG TPA: DUF2927 domain-containing protein [Bacteroidia bacterium]|jgi:hypothetical protein|nr:DUF2927 domain-containing protein [Bacteroidia bacterium]
MIRIIIIFIFLVSNFTAFCQEKNDKIFQKTYLTIIFNNGSSSTGGDILKKWNQDINILYEGDSCQYLKEVIDNVIAKTSSSIGNLKIRVVTTKADANYIISVNDSTTSSTTTKYHENWTSGSGNIYKCFLTINRVKTFNKNEQKAFLKTYFLKSLGNFSFSNVKTPINSSMYDMFNEITDFDLKVLSFHYSNNIKAGMTEKDVEKAFKSRGNN